MKKIATLFLLTAMVTLMFSGCASNQNEDATTTETSTKSEDKDTTSNDGDSSDSKMEDSESMTEEPLRVILLIPGSLGDKSFFDSANHGIELMNENLNVETKVVEMGTDYTKWEPNLLDALEGNWDIIVTGNAMTEMLNTFAPDYPEQKFINFDSTDTLENSNVYGIQYKANELSFLAGACAALVTNSDMELANSDSVIGFLGGMDIPGINDFLVGYIEGAKYEDENIKVMISYAGDFADPAKGKELSILQYNNSVDISFNVAGGTGLGLLDAAKERNAYAIGVDSDQALLFEDTDPEKSEHIVTSAVKKIDEAIYGAVVKHIEGTLEYGIVDQLGVAENGVGLAKNQYFEQLSDEIKAEIESVEAELSAGNIEVSTAYGMSTEEINEIRENVKP